MGKKFVSVIIVLAFILFSESCVIHRTTQSSAASLSDGPGLKSPIVRILLRSGETREFGKKSPAFLVGDAVVPGGGLVTVTTGGSVQVQREGDLYVIKTGDGKTYRVRSYRLDAKRGQLTYPEPAAEGIRLSDIVTVWIRQAAVGASVLASILATVGGLIIVAFAAWSGA
jgi:hypothetical protein